MMLASLSARERRLIAILILVAAIALLWLGVISPIATGFAERAEQRDRLAQVYANNSRLIASIGRLRKLAEVQRADSDRFHIVAPTLVAANEILKARLSDAVTDAGGQTRSVQEVEADPGRVGAWIEARMTLPQLVAVLGTLENRAPLLALSSLSVSADPAATSVRPDTLNVRIEASTWYDHAQSR